MTPEHGTDGTMTNGAATNTVRAQTRLGMLDIDPSKELFFPRGLMGFEEHHRFTLLKIRGEAPFLILQSLDDPKLGLLVGDPYAFLPEYRIRIGDAEQKMLQAADTAAQQCKEQSQRRHTAEQRNAGGAAVDIGIEHGRRRL